MAGMQKPGLGARKCAHCGARIEGPQSHLLRECPQCRSPLYGRFVPAPTTLSGTESKRASGSAGVVIGVIGFGVLASVGALGYALSTKKSAEGAVASPPSSTGIGPVLADTSTAGTASAPSVASTIRAAATTPTVKTAKPPASIVFVPPIASSVRPFPSAVPSASASALALNPVGAQRCNATLTVGTFRPSSPTCSFNEKVSRGPGKLEFPCDGGTAAATFGTQTFRGTVSSTTVLLTQSELFNFRGCSVQSTQRITGARSSSTASYSYSERIIGGSCTGVSTCTATATVEIR